MKQSEKVLIILAVIAVLVGGAVYLSGSVSKKTEPESAVDMAEKLEKMTADVDKANKVVQASEPGVLAAYVVAHSAVSYASDPFFYRAEAPEVEVEQVMEEEGEGPSIVLVYSGFMEVGGRRMVILNGQEYELGDDVAATGFILRKIRRDWVELAGREGKFFLRVPFAEEGF